MQGQGDDWMLPGGSQSSRDDVAYYQAETQMLTRENQMLKMRIRELGMPLAIRFGSPLTFRQSVSSMMAAP